MYIDQNNISHIITSVEWEGNHLMATIETANTRAGRDMAGLIRQGSRVGFSMRGVSKNVKRQGQYQVIESPLYIVTYDFVIVPSHADSYMRNIISESAEVNDILSESSITEFDIKDMVKEISKTSQEVQVMAESAGMDLDTTNSLVKDQINAKSFLESQMLDSLDSWFIEM